jgi:hypothetical protein
MAAGVPATLDEVERDHTGEGQLRGLRPARLSEARELDSLLAAVFCGVSEAAPALCSPEAAVVGGQRFSCARAAAFSAAREKSQRDNAAGEQ